MKIYTSYFGNLKNIPPNIFPVAICARSPSWFTGLNVKFLAPSYEILSKYKLNGNTSEYTQAYIHEILNFLYVPDVVHYLNVKSGGKDVVLLCYETPDKFCHRHLVADWLNCNGYQCKEYGTQDESDAMKISTSYFYQIRYFSKNMIPVSTAIWDPQWFHTGNNTGEYQDKNGVWNGIRMPILSPIKLDANICAQCSHHDPSDCAFQKNYREYLKSLDFDKIYQSLERLATTIVALENLSDEPHIVLIVHEKPNNPCSERKALQEFFTSHGIPCRELEYPIKKEEE